MGTKITMTSKIALKYILFFMLCCENKSRASLAEAAILSGKKLTCVKHKRKKTKLAYFRQTTS
jgi:hypothetical protein